MSNKSELSPTMLEALEEAKKNGGKLVRMPGGYWVKPGTKWAGSAPQTFWGTSTINALIDRNQVVVTKRQESRRRKDAFPIEVSLPMVRIWSGQWLKYWRANAGGYTTVEAEAGLFTREAAEKWLAMAGPEKMLEIRPMQGGSNGAT